MAALEEATPDAVAAGAPAPQPTDRAFRAPVRAIFNHSDFNNWQSSPVHAELLRFVRFCGDAVRNKPLTSEAVRVTDAHRGVVELLNVLQGWTTDIAPLQQPMRFGNKAFRTWHERLSEQAPALVAGLLPVDMKQAEVELTPYLLGSFGDPSRIDYGTGHEMAFTAFLYCLSKVGLFEPQDAPALVLRVFAAYIGLMRTLQNRYLLEPAGSHGAWGLDDFHCLPFVWGAAQLADHPNLTPASIHDEAVLEHHHADFMYLASILAIKRLKSGAPFAETSPMLNTISNQPNWRKVYTGMCKLFEGEVLGKMPVMQHFMFGTLLPCTWEGTGRPDAPAAAHDTSGAIEAPAPLRTRSSLPGYLMAAEAARSPVPTDADPSVDPAPLALDGPDDAPTDPPTTNDTPPEAVGLQSL